MRTDYSMWGGKPRRSLQILGMIAAHGDSDECLEWPHTINHSGYGIVQHEKTRWRVHRLAFKLAKPDEFDPDLDTLHKCDNPPCFNLKHLFQGTNADNIADKVSKGRQGHSGGNPALIRGQLHGCAKLTDHDVLEIRRLWGTGQRSQALIAADFKVTRGLVNQIILGRIWKHLLN